MAVSWSLEPTLSMTAKTLIEIGETWDATSKVRPERLPAGMAHVWLRRLDASLDEFKACYELLSSDERNRAQRFKIERPRVEFVLTRATLRSLLGHYLGIDADKVRFRNENRGKPLLDDRSDLCFNVSHTDGLALMAFVKSRSIGVDVEKVKPETEVAKLAERFFSARERRDLKELRGDELRAAFFRVWTRKEAYIKATGEGLSLPLDQFDVSIGAGERDTLRATRPDAAEAERWTVGDVAIPAGYAAAVAIAVHDENE